MRSSMSIPLVFPPVPLNGTWFVDGGVLDNNPIDMAVEWGADIIIDVDVGSFTASPPGDINTLGAVTDHTLRLIMSTSSMSSPVKGREDYYLSMDLKGFSWMDFSRSKELIDKGEALARGVESMKKLLEIAAYIETTRPLERRDWRRGGTYTRLPAPVFSRVRLDSIGADGAYEDPQSYADEFPAKYLDNIFAGLYDKEPDFDNLEEALELIRRKGRYQNVAYHLEAASGGQHVLVLTALRERLRKNRLDVSTIGSINLGAHSSMGLFQAIDLTLRGIPLPGSELSFGLYYSLSDVQGPLGAFALTQKLSPYWALRLELDGGYNASTVVGFHTGGELSTFGYANAGGSVAWTPAEFFAVGAFYHYAPAWYADKAAGASGVPTVFDDIHAAGIDINFDTIDVALPLYFSRMLWGLSWHARVEFPFAGSALYDANTFPWYERLELFSQKLMMPRSSRNFIADVQFGSYRGRLESLWTLYAASGKFGIPGYAGKEVLARNKFLVGLTYMEEITPLSNLLNMRSFFALTLRAGSLWQDIDSLDQFASLRGGLRAGLQIETPLGTLFAGPEVSFAGQGQFCVYFN
jgi:hypothetical protein